MVPATVEEVVNYRLDMLDMDSMAMAEYASCIGQNFDTGTVASNRLRGDPAVPLENLLSSGILIKKDDRIEFSHAVFRDVIYHGIGERWKLGYHKNIGEHLEKAYGENIDTAIYDLARHFSKTREHSKTVEYCIRAGEKAENSFAVEQAMHFYKDALDALSKIGAGPSSSKTLSVIERIADIYSFVGEHNKAIEEYTRIREATTDLETEARMHRKTAQAYLNTGDLDKCIQTAEQGKDLLAGAGSVGLGRLLHTQGYGYWRKGDYERATTLFKEALGFFNEKGGDQKDMGHTLRAIGNIYWSRGEYQDAIRYYEKSLANMKEGKDQRGIALALNNIGLVHLLRGELDRALGYYERSSALFEDMKDKHGMGNSFINIGELLQHKGELDKAMEYYERSLEIRESIGDKHGMGLCLSNIGWLYGDRGEMEKARDYLETSIEMAEGIGSKWLTSGFSSNLADVLLGLGRTDDAFKVAKRGLDLSLENEMKREEAVNRRSLGMVYREKKEWQSAEQEFNKAISTFKEMGEKNELAQTHYEIGILYKKKDNLEEAKVNLSKALEMFDLMGIKLGADKCKSALESL